MLEDEKDTTTEEYMGGEEETISAKGSGKKLDQMFEDVKNAFKDGRYKTAKRENKSLEKEIYDVRKRQKKAFSQFYDLLNKIDYREKQGFDVSEAKELLDVIKESIELMDFDSAFSHMEKAWDALERSLFIPFPFLEKDVSFKTVIWNDRNNILFEFEMINQMENALGEILLNIKTPQGFLDVPERRLGWIDSYENRSVQAELVPGEVEGNQLAELINDNKIVLESNLDCAYKNPVHVISVSNISDQKLKDVEIRPFVPEFLEPEEEKKVIDILEPSKDISVTFNLYPKFVEGKKDTEEEIQEDEFLYEVDEEEIKEDEFRYEEEEEEPVGLEEEMQEDEFFYEVDEEEIKEDEFRYEEEEGEPVGLEEEEIKEDEFRYEEEEIYNQDKKNSPLFLRDNLNYLLKDVNLQELYTKLSNYISNEENILVITQINPSEIREEYKINIAIDNFIYMNEEEFEKFRVIPPSEIHEEITYNIQDFISYNDNGIIFLESLGKIKTENGFDGLLDFIEEIWEDTRSTDFSLLVNLGTGIFTKAELKILEEKFRVYNIF